MYKNNSKDRKIIKNIEKLTFDTREEGEEVASDVERRRNLIFKICFDLCIHKWRLKNIRNIEKYN